MRRRGLGRPEQAQDRNVEPVPGCSHFRVTPGERVVVPEVPEQREDHQDELEAMLAGERLLQSQRRRRLLPPGMVGLEVGAHLPDELSIPLPILEPDTQMVHQQ